MEEVIKLKEKELIYLRKAMSIYNLYHKPTNNDYRSYYRIRDIIERDRKNEN